MRVLLSIIFILFLINTVSEVTSEANPIKSAKCDPAYPTVCIPSPPPDLDCPEVGFKNFKVLPPDPHHLDRDNDGIGCEAK